MNLTFTGQIDHEKLRQELVVAIGANGWYLNGSSGSVTFISTDDTIADPTATIEAHISNAIVRKQNAIWEKIKSKRDELKSGGVLVDGNWYQSDSDSRIQQLGLKDRGRDALSAVPAGTMTDNIKILGVDVQWKSFANTMVPMTIQLAFDIVSAVGELDAKLFQTAEQHRIGMMNATDPDTYDYSTGWPEVFVS